MGIWHKIRVTSKKECLYDIAETFESYYPNPELPWWEDFSKWYHELNTTGHALGASKKIPMVEADPGFSFFRTDDISIENDIDTNITLFDSVLEKDDDFDDAEDE